MFHFNHSSSRFLAAGAIAAAITLIGTGCSVIQQQAGDAWAVTYEVSVDQPSRARLADVRVEGAKRRGDAPEVHELGTVQTSTATASGSRWMHVSVVLAEQRAFVTATPGAGATATCRIMLDGKRVIETQTSPAPGKAVSCTTTTPKFD